MVALYYYITKIMETWIFVTFTVGNLLKYINYPVAFLLIVCNYSAI